jgi:hypothetical protein
MYCGRLLWQVGGGCLATLETTRCSAGIHLVGATVSRVLRVGTPRGVELLKEVNSSLRRSCSCYPALVSMHLPTRVGECGIISAVGPGAIVGNVNTSPTFHQFYGTRCFRLRTVESR